VTLPDERYRAIKQSRVFLQELCDRKQTPRIPGDVRRYAQSLLRHFPSDFELEQIAEQCPDYLDKISFLERIRMEKNNV